MHPAEGVEKEMLDIREQGVDKDGQPTRFERRVYCQLQVFTGCRDPKPLTRRLGALKVDNVLYRDVNDPLGVAALLIGEEDRVFGDEARELFLDPAFASLSRRPEMAMLGRTYSTGREQDLPDWMLERARRYALDPAWPWAVWYPLRRKPEFELLEGREKGKIMAEHGTIGRRFGEAGFVRDIRLACHGLNQNDNDFLLGLIGKELYPLSRLVQEMRGSQQTARHLDSLGPFFVGKVLGQNRPQGS